MEADGTRAGTVLVKNIDPGDGYYQRLRPSLTGVGEGCSSPPTTAPTARSCGSRTAARAGTVLVKNIRQDDYSSYPSYLTSVGGRLFFTAGDGVHGRELWKSDGSRAGTVLVKDIHPVRRRPFSRCYLTGVGGRLFFAADDGIHGEELWKSDGTRAGTVLVKDINAGGSTAGSPRRGRVDTQTASP